MEAITELAKIDFPSFFISIFLIITAIRAVITTFEWVISKLGLETKWMHAKRKDHDLLIKTSQNLAALQEMHEKDMEDSDRHDEEMQENIKKLTDMFIDKEIDDIRWEILNFASSLSYGRTFNRESFDHIMKIHHKYKQILGDKQMENGLVQETMKYITEKYHENLENGM